MTPASNLLEASKHSIRDAMGQLSLRLASQGKGSDSSGSSIHPYDVLVVNQG